MVMVLFRRGQELLRKVFIGNVQVIVLVVSFTEAWSFLPVLLAIRGLFKFRGSTSIVILFPGKVPGLEGRGEGSQSSVIEQESHP